MEKQKPDYGLDAPGVVRGLLIGGAAGVIVGYSLMYWAIGTHNVSLANLGAIAGNAGVGCLIGVGLMLWSSYYGKFRARDRLLARLKLSGDETILDVGCGHGLLLIAAAKQLPRGRAVGIDLWSQVDQANNSRQATLRNAQIEGVAERVEIRDADMRELPFADESFDAAVASLAIHNVPGRDERRKAIREIARVLKPGGKVALMDLKSAGLYADELRKCGMDDVVLSGLSFWIYPPVRTVTARKPEIRRSSAEKQRATIGVPEKI